jgi:hypothetical protein
MISPEDQLAIYEIGLVAGYLIPLGSFFIELNAHDP